MTLDKTIADQSDLKELCCDRSLETKEIFKPNSYYGIDYVIKTYSTLPTVSALKIIFPHAVSISNNFIWEEEKKAMIPCIYFYSPHRRKIYTNETNKIVLPAASPFVYLTELLKSQFNTKREGTIFFPAHSTHHVTSEVNCEKLAIDLDLLDDKYKPISVCMYWRDFNLGRHQVFKEKGFRIISAGHIFDPLFLFRFYHLCSTHKYSVSNELGTHLFYSVKSGCSFFFMNYEKIVRKGAGNILKRDMSTPDHKIANSLVKMFSKPAVKPTSEQLHTVDSYLGVENLKTPDEFRNELEFADKMDKYGLGRHPESRQMYYRLPNLVPRKLIRRIRHNIEHRASGRLNLVS